jgi:hypothetical protein
MSELSSPDAKSSLSDTIGTVLPSVEWKEALEEE